MPKVKIGNGKTEFGPGVEVALTGDEVATAIDAFLVARGIHVSGPRTISVNGRLCMDGLVYVDPSGFVISRGKKYAGRGGKDDGRICLECGEPRPCAKRSEILKRAEEPSNACNHIVKVDSGPIYCYQPLPCRIHG